MKTSMLTLLVAALSVLLVGCETIPRWARIDQPAAQAPDPRICAPIQGPPALPDGAGYPEAITPAERLAQARADAWLGQLTKWGERGWEIVSVAQAACEGD